MKKKIINILKPIIDSNKEISECMTNKKAMSFDEMIKENIISDNLDIVKFMTTISKNRYCGLLVSTIPNNDEISIYCTCNVKYSIFDDSGNLIIRPLKILSLINNEIKNGVKLNGKRLKLKSIKHLLDTRNNLYIVDFTNDKNINPNDDCDILDFYNKLMPILKETFEKEEIRSKFCMNDKTGSNLSLKELYCNGMIRLTPDYYTNSKYDNVFAMVDLIQDNEGAKMKFSIFGIIAEDDNNINAMELKVNELSNLIYKELLSMGIIENYSKINTVKNKMTTSTMECTLSGYYKINKNDNFSPYELSAIIDVLN